MEQTYTSWDKKQRTWNPETDGYVFVIVDAYPAHPTEPNRHIQFESGSVSIHMRDAMEAENWYSRIISRFPGYDWSKSNARIVKAPCAFDARANGVLLKSLTHVGASTCQS